MPVRLPANRHLPACLLAVILCGGALATSGATLRASSNRHITEALTTLQPGDTLEIEPGTYAGNILIKGLAGTASAPITIRGSDPASPPVFQSGSEALRLSQCHYVKLRHLRVNGLTKRGIAIDDGDAPDKPSHHIVVELVTISETGLRGHNHALEVAGAHDIIIRNCQFEAWGGAAISMSRAQRAYVSDCTFIGRERVAQASAVHIQAASSNVLIQSSYFRWAGDRAIQIGGDTNAPMTDAPFEVAAVEVAGNRIFGGLSAVVWATADGGHVHHNTIIFPHRWILRILQQGAEPPRRPCRNGIFTHNMVLYDARVANIVNVSEGTAPDTFLFASNAWHRTAGPRPLRLPTASEGDVFQVDPEITLRDWSSMRITSPNPHLQDKGADSYTPVPPPFTLP